MATEKQKYDWIKVDPTALSETLKAKYAALTKANAAQRAAQDEFEAAFISGMGKANKIPAGKRMLFGYRYGGLAITLADKEETKPRKGAVTWADLIK